MVMQTLLIGVILVAAGSITSVANGAEPTEELARYRHHLAGLRSSREALVSWQFKATGRLQDHGGTLAGDVVFVNAMDTAKQALRFDFSGPAAMPQGVERIELRFARAPDKSLHYMESPSEGPSYVSVQPRDTPCNTMARPFDIRVLGLSDYPFVRESFEETFARLNASPAEEGLVGIRDEPEGLVAVTWELKGIVPSRNVLWIDTVRGYVPILAEQYVFDINTKEWPTTPGRKTELAWKQVHSVWIPTSYEFTDELPPFLGGPSQAKWSLAFDWQLVNKPIPTETFEEKGLEGNLDSRILDSRTGQVIDTGSVRDLTDTPSPLASAARGRTWRTWLMFAGGTLMTLLAVIMVGWRKKA